MLMETYYLVDFENVHGEGMEGIEKLSMSDHVRLFYTDNAPKVSLDIFQNIFEGLKFETEKVAKGKQSLDMHLVSYLGFLIGQNLGKDCAYVIISKDTDYDHVLEYWNQKCGVLVAKRRRIAPEEAVNALEPKVVDRNETDKNEIEKSTPENRMSRGTRKRMKKEASPNENGTGVVNYPKEVQQKDNHSAMILSELPEGLNNEIRQVLFRNSYDQTVIDGVANLVVECYGQERLSFHVHNKLNSSYRDSAYAKNLYELIKPILKKYSNETTTSQSPLTKESDEKVRLNNEVQQVLSKEKVDSDIIGSVASLVTKKVNEKNAKQTIYRSIISQYGQKRGLNIYNLIKKLL